MTIVSIFSSSIWKTSKLIRWKSASFVLRRFSAAQTIESNEYLSSLYSRLSARTQYKFLEQYVPNEETVKVDHVLASTPEFQKFIKVLAQDDKVLKPDVTNIEKEFVSKFQDWTKVSQLRVGFLMHLDKRINSSQYLLKVIKHMSSTNLYQAGSHDLTALMLLIYFKRDLSVEDMSEFMDLDNLQDALGTKIGQNEFSKEEVCAICLGLKKIQNMKVSSPFLRRALYKQLCLLEVEKVGELDDFIVVTLLTTLSKGNMIFHDEHEIVTQTLKRLQLQLPRLKIDSVMKIMTFPLTLGLVEKSIELFVAKNLQNNLESLKSWDLLQLCYYISKQPEHEFSTDEIVSYLEDIMDNIKFLDDIIDLIECFHYLSHINVYSRKFNNVLFDAINTIPSDMFFKDSDYSNMSDIIFAEILSRLGCSEVGDRGKDIKPNYQKTLSVLTRIPAFISHSYKLDRGISDISINEDKLNMICKAYHKQLPMELYVPQMNLKNVDNRTKRLITCYRALSMFMGSEIYVGVSRILPHFTEPDLVFGNIAGNCLSIPNYLTDPDFVGVRKPPPGEWWALVIGTRKSHDLSGNIIGQEAAKLRQLEKIGYTPIIVHHNDLRSLGAVSQSLVNLLKSKNVQLPNLDDGIYARHRKF